MPSVEFSDPYVLRQLAGDSCSHLKIIEESTGAKTSLKGNTIELSGEDFAVELAEHALKDLYKLVKSGYPLFADDVWYAVRMLAKNRTVNLEEVFKDSIYISSTKKVIVPKSLQQKRYIDTMRVKDVSFGIGPAGTGKTYLAVACAVAAFREKNVNRIILTRPAIEAGEKLGFLPGDLQSKVDPYLRPLYDALFDMLGAETYQKYLERGYIEVAPLAYMRGRTLDDSFIILDEAQNTTPEQMKMFLTRLGFGSKAVITGDITQIDLPDGKYSGLKDAMRVLRNVEDISQCMLTQRDVVRHVLVQRIIDAYEKSDIEKKTKKKK